MSIALSLFERDGLQVFLGQDDEAPFLVLVTLDEIFPRHRLPFALAHALVPHGRLVPRVQHAELRTVVANGGMQFDRDGHQPERNGAFPDCARHDILRPMSGGHTACKVYAGF